MSMIEHPDMDDSHLVDYDRCESCDEVADYCFCSECGEMTDEPACPRCGETAKTCGHCGGDLWIS
jgi:hypothetical protein